MTDPLPPGWSAGFLGDVIAKITAGTSANCEDREFEPGDRGVLKLSAVSRGRIDPKEAKVVAPSEHKRLRTPVRSGTVLFTRKNSPELVGDSAYVAVGSPNLYLPDLIWELNACPGVEPRWLNNWLQSSLFRRQVPALSAGSSQSMVGISQANLSSSPVLIPPAHEQQRIVRVFDAWDQAIGLADDIVHAKARSFQAIRTRLFRDLAETEEIVALRQVLMPAPRKQPSSLQGRKLLTVRLHCQGVIENETQLPRNTKSGRPYYERNSGELIIGRQNFHNGGIGIVPEHLKGFLASNAISSFKAQDERTSVSYVCHFLMRPAFYKKAEILMGGTGQKELSDEEFLRMRIPLPSRSKQEEIASLLNLKSNEIALLQREAEALRTQKRGLMQKLLTGKQLLGENFQ